MRKKENRKQQYYGTLRKCGSNEVLLMDVIPQITRGPHFVRKIRNQESKIARVNSLTSRKNRLDQYKTSQLIKSKPPTRKNAEKQYQTEKKIFRDQQIKDNSQQSLLPMSFSELQTNITNRNPKQSGSDRFETESRVSSSCKSVKFSTHFEDQIRENSRSKDSRGTPSILKSKNVRGSMKNSMGSQKTFSINNSVHSNWKQTKKKTAQETTSNLAIKKKFESIVKNLQLKNSVRLKPPLPGKKSAIIEKYRDQIFPPVYSSLFMPNQKGGQRGKQIEWVRISDLYPGEDLAVYQKPETSFHLDTSKEETSIKSVSLVGGKSSYVSQFLLTAFNCIKNNLNLLEKMFQGQEISPNGVYLIKIFQETAWKYVIIDDYIPVIPSNKGPTETYSSAFTRIVAESNASKPKKQNRGKDSLPIWPLLLEKAYAKYYSSYESLSHGNTLNFLQELTGMTYEKIDLTDKKDPQDYLKVIQILMKQMRNGDSVCVAQLKQTEPMIPLYYKAQFCYSTITEEQLTYYDPHHNYLPTKIKFYDLGLICTTLYLFNSEKFTQVANCTVSKPRHKVSAALMSQISPRLPEERSHRKQKAAQGRLTSRDVPSIRKFRINSDGECRLFIRQRDTRLVFKMNIDYLWVRAILIAEETLEESSFRWVDGEYSNKKDISMDFYLQAGNYFLLLFPEWSKQSKFHNEIHVSLFSNEQIEFERESHVQHTKMLELACLDLAQSRGRLNQINQFICSYYYLDRKTGLIIENINNERTHGEVIVVRSISGLKSKVEIVPVNDEFFQDSSKDEKQSTSYLATQKSSIDVKIPQKTSFTVVLKMRGGIDYNFFRSFAFGS